MAAHDRFLATATPSPNRYLELVNYADWLGVMDRGQALTRFFQRNSTSAGDLTLHPHKQDEFWLWLSTWSVFLVRPSDLGYPDDGYDLPDLEVAWHEVPVDHTEVTALERDGQARMFRGADLGVGDAHREKRSTIAARVAKAAELVAAASAEEHFILWHLARALYLMGLCGDLAQPDEERLRALCAHVTSDDACLMPGVSIGEVVGTLSFEQATALGAMAQAGQTYKIDDAGDIRVAVAA